MLPLGVCVNLREELAHGDFILVDVDICKTSHIAKQNNQQKEKQNDSGY